MSCDLNSTDENDDFGSIESNILVLVTEAHLEVGPPSIVTHFETEDLEPCSNYEIINEFSVEGEVLVNDFEGIFRPNVCSEPEEPATSTNFTDIQEGEYLLEIYYEENTDLYNIVITEDSITIDAEQSSFTSAPYEVSWRFPENSFVYACGTSDGSSDPCDEFEGILTDSLDLQEYTFPDRGYVPYPGSTQEFEYNAPALYFTYNDPADFEETGNLLSDYEEDIDAAASGVTIFLVNWESMQFVAGLEDT